MAARSSGGIICEKAFHGSGQNRPAPPGGVFVYMLGDSIAPFGGHFWLKSLIRLAEPLGLNERLVQAAPGLVVMDEAYQPFAANQISFTDALARGEAPLRSFMLKQTRQADLSLFAKLAKLDPAVKPETVPLRVLVPAFVTSELKSAFQIGFLIFIPFLVIDMVVASVLMSLGMMMLSPVLVALPFKLMLFVLADGWNLLLGSLAASFVQ